METVQLLTEEQAIALIIIIKILAYVYLAYFTFDLTRATRKKELIPMQNGFVYLSIVFVITMIFYLVPEILFSYEMLHTTIWNANHIILGTSAFLVIILMIRYLCTLARVKGKL